MVQSLYSLPDLIDLALTVPKPGRVNFNIMHTVLHAIVKELGLEEVYAGLQSDIPLLTDMDSIRAKLVEAKRKRPVAKVVETSEVGSDPVPEIPKYGSEEPNTGVESQTKVSDEEQVSKTDKTESPETSEGPAPVEEDAQDPELLTTTEKTQLDSTQIQLDSISDDTQRKDSPPATIEEDSAIQAPERSEDVVKKLSSHRPPEPIKQKIPDRDLPEKFIFEPTDVPELGPEARPQRAGDALRYTNINMRVTGTEEGLRRLSNIVDILVDKMRKAELRKKAGFSSEELELLDERITELEEMMARLLADHELLMELEKLLRDMLAQFEEIKALAALLKQMQIDISKKADKEETWAALALKGDLELVMTKVDQLEFETAFEELGEAIGLLGIKFTKKNEEWEERAADIWRAIDGKMSRDIFDQACAVIESRLTALMYGLRKMKKVIEDLLYPESSGVTRCILCRRPACISGLECMSGILDSPKRPRSGPSEDGDTDKLRKTLEGAIVKRQKLEAPPYCKSRDTIISVPYSSSTYRSNIDGKPQYKGPSQMKLAPNSTKSQPAISKKPSEIPKLPDIRKKSSSEPPNISESKSSASIGSSVSGVDMAPDPEKALETFAPARLMPDSSRKDVLVKPSSRKEQKLDLTLSPGQFDEEAPKH